jgi:hypothetical protein
LGVGHGKDARFWRAAGLGCRFWPAGSWTSWIGM